MYHAPVYLLGSFALVWCFSNSFVWLTLAAMFVCRSWCACSPLWADKRPGGNTRTANTLCLSHSFVSLFVFALARRAFWYFVIVRFLLTCVLPCIRFCCPWLGTKTAATHRPKLCVSAARLTKSLDAGFSENLFVM